MNIEEAGTSRRTFLAGALGGIAATAGVTALLRLPSPTFLPVSAQDTLFLTWQSDPTTTITVQWIAPFSASAANIHYGVLNEPSSHSIVAVQRPFPTTDLCVHRAEILGLAPGTEYQFRISGSPEVHRFRTMPKKATKEFQFISGGDCGVNEHVIANNILAAKQDPMFALIGGDLAYDNGRHPDKFLDFLRNYSRYMIDSERRLIPMVVCIGNHELKNGYNCTRADGPYFFALFDGLFAERTFATLDFGDYLSLVLLDTGHVAPIAGEQTSWLERRLAERTDYPHLFVANHVPAYPSFRDPESHGDQLGIGQENREHWVPLFEKYNVNVVLEHHDHTFKRTHPLLGGHVDSRGVLYLGDGSWGKIRPPKSPEQRSYLAVAEEQYHITLHRLEGANAFHMALSEHGRIMDVCTTTKRAQS